MNSSWQEGDYKRTVSNVTYTQFLPGTSIEIVHPLQQSEPPQHVLFDFDGTLSLIREGWPEVMVPMMVEELQNTGTDEDAEALRQQVYEFVMQLNGKQTIYQMIRLAEEVAKRGGQPADPLHYKQRYHDRLMQRIAHRHQRLQRGELAPQELLVPASLELLQALRERGATLYLASGTDENYVRQEADLLGLTPFFGDHVYGAQDDYQNFSKAQVIDRILSQHRVDGATLLGFGDGYVEIQNIKAVGGIAVAVASDESQRSGLVDAWKRDRLIGVGADLVIPDYQHWRALVSYLWRDA